MINKSLSANLKWFTLQLFLNFLQKIKTYLVISNFSKRIKLFKFQVNSILSISFSAFQKKSETFYYYKCWIWKKTKNKIDEFFLHGKTPTSEKPFLCKFRLRLSFYSFVNIAFNSLSKKKFLNFRTFPTIIKCDS